MFISTNVFHQTIAIFPVKLTETMMGVGCGWLAPTLNSLRNSNSEFSLNTEECSWVASMHYVGRMVGPLLSAVLIDSVGRNNVLIISAFISFFIWIIVLSARSVFILYVIRFVFGLAVGMFDAVSPIYICENSSPNVRGVFNSITIAFFYMGELLAFIFATYFRYDTVAILHAAIGFFTFLSVFLLKEPAQFLILKGQDEKAEKHFFWLRGSETEARKEFDDIKLYVFEEKSKFSWKLLLKNEENRRCLRVVLVTYILMFCTGFPAINSLVSIAFSSSESLTSNEFTILYGFFQFLGVSLSSYGIDRFGRRTLLLAAAGASAVVHALTGALYYVHGHVQELPYFAWMIFATITTYGVIFAMVLLPLSGTTRGEILPQSVKAVGGSIAVMTSSAISFVMAKIFLVISDSYGIETNFFLFALTSLILAVYVYVDLPETKGMTLVEIQKSLKK